MDQCKGEHIPKTKSQDRQHDWIKTLKIRSIEKRRMPLSKYIKLC